MALVRNVEGSGNDNPPNGFSSWKEFWEARMKKSFSLCSRVDCFKTATDGAHVENTQNTGERFIVPLCEKCNNPSNRDSFEVDDSNLLRIK